MNSKHNKNSAAYIRRQLEIQAIQLTEKFARLFNVDLETEIEIEVRQLKKIKSRLNKKIKIRKLTSNKQ